MENSNFDNIRTAREVIDDAIAENKPAEFLLYGFALTFVLVGLFVLVYGVLRESTIISVLGTVASSLFWPAMKLARQTRKENIVIRLLEAPLSRADTSQEASKMLHKLVDEIMRGGNKNG